MVAQKQITHQDVLARLTPQTREQLQRLSNHHGLTHLALYGFVLALFSLLIVIKIPYWYGLMLPQGIMLAFLFTLLHETVHETPFRTSWLNHIVGRIAGFLLITPFTWFRYFHLAHHRYTHVPDKDPELQTPKPQTLMQYLIHLSGIPVWFGNGKLLFIHAFARHFAAYIPRKKQHRVMWEARVYLLLYLSCVGLALYNFQRDNSVMILWLWVIPVLLGQPFLRAYLLAEHTLCPHIANMLENTRTIYTMRLIRFLAWNMPYHTAHHIHPLIPFHQLPAFNRIIASDLRQISDGYQSFHQKLRKQFS